MDKGLFITGHGYLMPIYTAEENVSPSPAQKPLIAYNADIIC